MPVQGCTLPPFKKNSAIFDQKYTLVCIGGTRYSCRILMELELSGQIFEKYTNVKFYENQCNGSRVVPFRRTDRQADRLTDMRNLIVAFRDFAKAPENSMSLSVL